MVLTKVQSAEGLESPSSRHVILALDLSDNSLRACNYYAREIAKEGDVAHVSASTCTRTLAMSNTPCVLAFLCMRVCKRTCVLDMTYTKTVGTDGARCLYVQTCLLV